jgi:hypothetical protein
MGRVESERQGRLPNGGRPVEEEQVRDDRVFPAPRSPRGDLSMVVWPALARHITRPRSHSTVAPPAAMIVSWLSTRASSVVLSGTATRNW